MSARYYDLNTGEILEAWSVRHAVRELIANALDEQALSNSADVEISEMDKRTWCIRDYGRGLNYDHLRQSESAEKAEHANKVIGKFGFGLKDALATLHRHKVSVTIRSRHGLFSLEVRAKAGFSNLMTLHVAISDAEDAEFVGTQITLSNVDGAEIAAAKTFFVRFSDETMLESTTLGQILARPAKGNARVYLKGLLVAEEEDFLFSYNVTSLTKSMENALNRERTNVGRNAYRERLMQMLLRARSASVAEPLAAEMRDWEFGGSSGELQWGAVGRHVIKILSAQGYVIVSASAARDHAAMLESAEADGHRAVVVPDMYVLGAERGVDLNGNPIRTLTYYIEQHAATFRFEFVARSKLSAREREVYDQWRSISDVAGGMPKCVKSLEITETMRPDYANSGHTHGLWAPDLQAIIVHRAELKSLKQFAATLLHEIAHARSGHTDVTRGFEEALTVSLGVVAARALNPNPKPRDLPKTKSKRREVGRKRS